MRIGIDARMIAMSGIGTYLRNLIEGLGRLNPSHEFLIFLQPKDRCHFVSPCSSFSVVDIDACPYSISEQTHLGITIEKQELDLIHHPHYVTPLWGRTPMVATIHDLIHQKFPEFCPSRFAWRVSCFLARRTAQRAKFVMTVSEHSRKDIIAHLGVSSEKVLLTYNSLPPGWGGSDSASLPSEIVALGGHPYFLYVGNHKAHKNIPLLLEAFSKLHREAPEVRMVLTGNSKDLEGELARFRLGDEVVFLGDISHYALRAVYAAARALVFPSRYEGFGLPPLEAMACGTPPIVSDAASLPEVVGEAGVIVPEGEVEPLRAAMLRLLREESYRRKLSQMGLTRAGKFSWRTMAEGTLHVYESAVAGDGQRN